LGWLSRCNHVGWCAVMSALPAASRSHLRRVGWPAHGSHAGRNRARGPGVSPSAARALYCRAVRTGASAPCLDDRRRFLLALAAVGAVWQPPGAPSRVRPRRDYDPQVPGSPALPPHVRWPAVCAATSDGAQPPVRPSVAPIPR
jgi:hypothetical protein